MSMTTLWIVWALIGVIGGYMGSRLLLGGSKMICALLSGLVGSLLGGWAYVTCFDFTEQNGYVSLITSMIACAVCVWIFISVCSRLNRNSSDNE